AGDRLSSLKSSPVAVLLFEPPPLRLRLFGAVAGLARQLREEFLCGRVGAGSFDATLRTPKLDVPGHLVALRPFLQLLDREQRVGVGHQRVILRIDLAELARLRLVLAEVETRLAEEELVVSIAERPVDCVHVVGLAPRRPAAGIAHGLRRDVARGRIGHLAAAAVRQRLRVVMQRGRPRGASCDREQKDGAAHATRLARAPRPDQTGTTVAHRCSTRAPRSGGNGASMFRRCLSQNHSVQASTYPSLEPPTPCEKTMTGSGPPSAGQGTRTRSSSRSPSAT